jgi:hypothetical protein
MLLITTLDWIVTAATIKTTTNPKKMARGKQATRTKEDKVTERSKDISSKGKGSRKIESKLKTKPAISKKKVKAALKNTTVRHTKKKNRGPDDAKRAWIVPGQLRTLSVRSGVMRCSDDGLVAVKNESVKRLQKIFRQCVLASNNKLTTDVLVRAIQATTKETILPPENDDDLKKNKKAPGMKLLMAPPTAESAAVSAV